MGPVVHNLIDDLKPYVFLTSSDMKSQNRARGKEPTWKSVPRLRDIITANQLLARKSAGNIIIPLPESVI
jgi:hypothetical protein